MSMSDSICLTNVGPCYISCILEAYQVSCMIEVYETSCVPVEAYKASCAVAEVYQTPCVVYSMSCVLRVEAYQTSCPVILCSRNKSNIMSIADSA